VPKTLIKTIKTNQTPALTTLGFQQVNWRR